MDFLELTDVNENLLMKIRNNKRLSGSLHLLIKDSTRNAQILESYGYDNCIDKILYLHLKKTVLTMIINQYALTPSKCFNFYILKQIKKAPILVAYIQAAQTITQKNRMRLLLKICKESNSQLRLKHKKQKDAYIGILPNIKINRRNLKWLNQTI